MNKLIPPLSALVLACALASAQAEEPKDAHADHQAASQSAPDATRMKQMQENMQTMRDLMTRVRAAHDPAARDELLKQHREHMQAQMKMMQDMEPMGGGCGSMMGGGDAERHSMMQMMMGQMMEHMTQAEAH